MTLSTTKAVQENQKFADVSRAAGGVTKEQAKALLDEAAALELAATNTGRLLDETDRLGRLFVTQSGALVRFTGYVDDLVRVGRGEPRDTGTPTPMPTPYQAPLMPLSPSQRREIALIGAEAMERIPLLQDRLQQLNNMLKAGNVTNKERLTITTNIANTEKEIAGIYEDQAAKIKAANEELKNRAEAIKSAVIERLQRRQTDVLNKRALADAKEQMRIARQLGGPAGIQMAARELQDVRFDIMRARLEAAPATLTKGGQFTMAGVVININGITDPDQVAAKVAAILKRRNRHTTTQTRGPGAGVPA